MHEQRCWADLCAGRLDAATDRLDQILSRSRQRSFYDKSDLAQLRLEAGAVEATTRELPSTSPYERSKAWPVSHRTAGRRAC